MVTTSVGKATVRRDVWSILYELLTGASGLSDTQSPVRSRADWVMSAFPDKSETRAGVWKGVFPIVVISPAEVSGSDFTLKRAKRALSLFVDIQVWAKSMKDLDTLGDDVMNLLTTNAGVLAGYGLQQLSFASSDYANVVLNEGVKVHTLVVSVGFMVRDAS